MIVLSVVNVSFVEHAILGVVHIVVVLPTADLDAVPVEDVLCARAVHDVLDIYLYLDATEGFIVVTTFASEGEKTFLFEPI